MDVNMPELYELHDGQVRGVLNNLSRNHGSVLVFIEVYGASVSLFKYGLEQGYQIVILTANSGMCKIPDEILRSSALSICLDTSDHDKVVSAVRYIHHVCSVRAVIPGFEYFVPVACMAAHAIELQATAMRDLLCIRNKLLMRKRMQQAGLDIPRFVAASSLIESSSAFDQIGLPAVCKPIDAAGSVHVRRVTTEADAEQAASAILNNQDVLWGYRLSSVMLVEEYIEGDEYSVEGVVSDGHATIFAITKKLLADQIEFIEIGHIVNPELPSGIDELIRQYIKLVIRALKPNACAFHAELRINRHGQPVLMELAARLPGDKIGDLIMLSNQDHYYHSVYQAYLGERVVSRPLIASSAGIRFFYRPQIGRYESFDDGGICDRYSPKELTVYYPPHTDIPAFPKPLRRLGHVILSGTNSGELQAAFDDIDALVKFRG